MNKQLINTVFLLVIVSVFSACSKREVQTENDSLSHSIQFTEEELVAANVKIGKLELTSAKQRISCSGVIDVPPQSLATISSPLGGTVKDVRFYPGDKVKRGEQLAIIENIEFIKMQEEFLSGYARKKFLDKELERQRKLVAGEASSRRSLEEMESEAGINDALISSLGSQLQLLGINPEDVLKNGIRRNVVISSPIDGFISKVNVNLGKTISGGEELYEIVNKDHLHVELSVFEKDAAQLMKDQEVEFYLPSSPNSREKATVYLVGQTVDKDSRVVSVHCHLEDHVSDLKPGTYVQAEILNQVDSVWFIPQSALVQEGEEYSVFVRDSSGFSLVPVFPDFFDDKGAYFNEVSLKEKDIVLTGAFELWSELKTREE